MGRIKSFSIVLSLLVVAGFGLNSCGKKCAEVTKEDVYSGKIVTDEKTFLYPASGGLTDGMELNNYMVTGDHKYAHLFEVSFDGGLTRDTVDYSRFTILAYPMIIKCNASFVREVIVDHTNNMVIYNITATQCNNGSCNEKRFIENYVLVEGKIPSTYSLVFNPEIIDAE